VIRVVRCPFRFPKVNLRKSRMRVALQDAGCDSADILGHCRGPGPHVRGCWVVDMVLGKE